MAGSGPKFSKTQRAEVKAIVAMLDRRGYSQYQIQRELAYRHDVHVSQPQIAIYLKQIRDNYNKIQLNSREEFVAEKMLQYREIRSAAWEAYDKSMEDSNKEVIENQPVLVKSGEDPDSALESAQRLKQIITKEGRLPDNSYLQTVLKTLEAERQLRGFDPPRETGNNTNVNVTTNVVNIDQLTQSFKQQALDMSKKLVDDVLAPQQVQVGLKELNGNHPQ